MIVQRTTGCPKKHSKDLKLGLNLWSVFFGKHPVDEVVSMLIVSAPSLLTVYENN